MASSDRAGHSGSAASAVARPRSRSRRRRRPDPTHCRVMRSLARPRDTLVERAINLALGIRRAEQPRRLEHAAQRPAAMLRLELEQWQLAHVRRAWLRLWWFRWTWPRRRCRRLRHAVAAARVWLALRRLAWCAPRQLEPMHLADHRTAGDAAAVELGRDLACAVALGP